MTAGAVSELALNAAALKVRGAALEFKRTSAEEIADRLNIPVPDGVSLDFPDWLKRQISAELIDVFKQPYWDKISETTRTDVAWTVEDGLMEGWSIRRIAKSITDNHGVEYTRARATAVARTETGGAMNSGHVMGIQRLQDETGLEMGKEFLSVLGTTTRDTHATADGQIVGVNEDFNIGGYMAPYPGHYSLPVQERANCQCGILSTFVGEATREEPAQEKVEPAAEQSTEPTPPTPDELAALPILDALAAATQLDDKAAKVIKATEKKRKKFLEVNAEYDALDVQLQQAWREFNRVQESFLRGTATQEEVDAAAKAVADAETAIAPAMTKRGKAQESLTEAGIKALALPMKERVAWKVPYHADGTTTMDDKGRRISTGKFSAEYKAMAKEALAILSKLTSVDASDTSRLAINLRWHAAESGVRAHYRGIGWRAPANDDSLGVVLDGANNRMDVFAHELMHHFENINKLTERCEEFRLARIDRWGTRDERFVDTFPAAGYDASEIGNEDAFSWVYAARGEDALESKRLAMYVGKNYGGAATEILTMGIQELIRDAENFARTDPEWFKFTIGCLDGTIKPRKAATAATL